MSVLQDFADWMSVKKFEPGPGVAIPAAANVTSNQNPYLTKGSLTFSGLTTAAGLILNVVAHDNGGWRVVASIVLALIIGGFLTFLALIDDNKSTKPGTIATIWFLGFMNTAIFAITIYGLSSIPGSD